MMDPWGNMIVKSNGSATMNNNGVGEETGKTVRVSMGIKIRTLRKQHGLTQMDLAKQLGYSSTGAISNIEKGIKGMDIEKVNHTAMIFGVHPAILLSTIPMDEDKMITVLKLSQLIFHNATKYLPAIQSLIDTAWKDMPKDKK